MLIKEIISIKWECQFLRERMLASLRPSIFTQRNRPKFLPSPDAPDRAIGLFALKASMSKIEPVLLSRKETMACSAFMRLT